MASKKKLAISDLIKNDMAQRNLGEISKTAEEEKEVIEKAAHNNVFREQTLEKTPPEAVSNSRSQSENPIDHAITPKVHGEEPEGHKTEPKEHLVILKDQVANPASLTGFNEIIKFIAKQAESAGLEDEADVLNLCEFLRGQSLRYIRGFSAARRFYG